MGRIRACLLVLAVLGACGGSEAGSGDRVAIGAVSFAENQIVAEMYAQVLEAEGLEVERRFNFPDRESLLPELENGAVDLAPEYLASLLTAMSDAEPSAEPDENVAELTPVLEKSGLELLQASAADDTNAFVVTSRTAKRYDLAKVSDLKAHGPHLVLGGPPECPQRQFCLRGLRDVYDIRFRDFRSLDAGGPLTVAALTSGEIDVALIFSTSGVIAERDWVLLEDDKGLQAAENITPVIRSEVMTADIADALDRVSAALTTDTMTRLNALVEVEGKDFREVARSFLVDEGLIEE